MRSLSSRSGRECSSEGPLPVRHYTSRTCRWWSPTSKSAPDIAAALAPDRWHYVPPELDGRLWRRFFVKAVDGRRAGHLHVMARGSARRGEQLAFPRRAARRSGPAQRYVTLKQTLAVRHADDREAYTAAKSDFVRSVLAQQR